MDAACVPILIVRGGNFLRNLETLNSKTGGEDGLEPH